MSRNWFRSPCPEAFFAGNLLLFDFFSFLFSVYLAAGGIFQGIPERLPFFLAGGGIALLLLRLIREPETHSLLLPLALTAAACVPGLFCLPSPIGKTCSGGLSVLAGLGVFLPGAVLLHIHGSRAIRPMTWGFLCAAPVWFLFPEQGWSMGGTIPILLLIAAGFCRKRSFRFLIPLAAALTFFFLPGQRTAEFPQEKIPEEQMELTELILSLQHRKPWTNPCLLPAPPCRDFLQGSVQNSGGPAEGPYDLAYFFPGFSGPASDTTFRTLSPEGLRELRKQTTPSGVLAVTLPELDFLPEKEADRFRAQVFAEAGRIFPYAYCTRPPLRLLIASKDPEITLDGSLLSERLAAVPQKGRRVESPHEVLEVVLPLLALEKRDVPWDPENARAIQREFLEKQGLCLPQFLRTVLPFRHWIFGGFLLLALLIRYCSAFHSRQRMAAGCFRSGWSTALPLSVLLFSGTMTLGRFLSAVLAILFVFALLPRPQGEGKRCFLLTVQLLILLFLLLFPERQILSLILLLPTACAARFTIPEKTGTAGVLPWFAGAFSCGVLCQMLLAEGCDRIAQGLLLLSLLLP